MDYKSIFLETLKDEAFALANYKGDLSDLENIIDCMLNTEGKVFISGVGKSGLIAQKISATLSSVGVPCVFLHPVEAMHGDLGMLESKDIFIAISYSGSSSELNALIPYIKRAKIKVITMSKSKDSDLSKMGDYFLPISIHKEACPLNTIPTTSTTLTLAMGDAIAICLMKARNFSKYNFAYFHPGGALGRDLFLKVKDIMQSENLPLIGVNVALKDAILTMSEKRLGSAIFVDNDNKVLGILSDGDLRRAMTNENFSVNEKAFLYATKNPKILQDSNILAIDALNIIKENKIQLLIIADDDKKIQGILHLHTLLNIGFRI